MTDPSAPPVTGWQIQHNLLAPTILVTWVNDEMTFKVADPDAPPVNVQPFIMIPGHERPEPDAVPE